MAPRAVVLALAAALVLPAACSHDRPERKVVLPRPSTTTAAPSTSPSGPQVVSVDGDDILLFAPEIRAAAARVGLARLPFPVADLGTLARRPGATAAVTLNPSDWAVVWPLGTGEVRWWAALDADASLHDAADRCHELELPAADERIIHVKGAAVCAISGLAQLPPEQDRQTTWCEPTGSWCYGLNVNDPEGSGHSLQDLVDLIEPGLRDLAQS